jgi:hypothetical protein
MSEFEAKPPKTAIEQLISALSIKTANMDREGSGGTPELETAHFAAMLAGIPGTYYEKQIAEHLLFGKYLSRDGHINRLGAALHAWSASHILYRFPTLETSGNLHRKVGSMAAECFCDEKRPSVRIAKAHGLGRKRWESHESVFAVMMDKLYQAEEKLAEQARREIRCVTSVQNRANSAVS